MKTIVIAGGGASGMMAAICAARKGAKVTLLEANDRLGRKLCASGNGRCNLTNLGASGEAYRGQDPSFAYDVLSRFSPQDTVRFFKELGLPTLSKEGWIYPSSEDSRSVLLALMTELESLKVKVKTKERVVSVERNESGLFIIKTETWHYEADAFILAAGTPASAVKGSSEDGYALAAAFGHSLVPPLPALVPLMSSDHRLSAWGSFRVRGSVSLLVEGQRVITREGRLQTIDRGISGIPVLQVSRFAAKALSEGKRVTAELDLLPDMTEVEARLYFENARNKGLSASQILALLLPGKVGEALLIKGAESEDQIRELKQLSFDITATGHREAAQIMCGGIATAEVDPATMASRLIPGLYLTGELLDVDGDCGGWNLQFAWATGSLAGNAAAEE